MDLSLIGLFWISTLHLLPTKCSPISRESSKVLLVSFDGFRWDYLRMYNTSWFHYVAETGATTTDFSYQPAFITKSFPGHYSIVTGLYEESNGVVDNTMIDPLYKTPFTLKNRSAVRDPFWWNVEPIWITAERAGRRSGTFFWPGSETMFGGYRQKFWKIFDSTISYKTRVDTVIHWLCKEDISFATLYFEEPDRAGHRYGPLSIQTRNAVESMNKVLGYLIQKLKEAKIYNSVNLVLTSDHGMSVYNYSTVIPIYNIIDQQLHLVRHIVSSGASFGITAKPGKTEQLYQNLRNEVKKHNYSMVTIYLKDDIPARFHYKNNRRIPEIFVLAKEGFYLLPRKPRRRPSTKRNFGVHGYDNAIKNMQPYFIARGPEIKSKARIRPFQQVDIYNLLARLLKVEPKPNNGSWERISGILKNPMLPIYSPVLSSASKISTFAVQLISIILTLMRNQCY